MKNTVYKIGKFLYWKKLPVESINRFLVLEISSFPLYFLGLSVLDILNFEYVAANSLFSQNMKRSGRTRQAAVKSNVTSAPTTLKTDASAVKNASNRGRKRAAKSNERELTEQKSPYFATSTTTAQPLAGGTRLERSFYNQGTIQLAQALLGKVLCRKLPETGQIMRGTIVETEAYPGVGDAASHSFKGTPTQSSMAMFMDPGTAYVYMTYGMYYCFNISAKDTGGACLLRAVEVLEDYDIMHSNRQSKRKKALSEATSSQETKNTEKRLKLHELANGPSKLCLAFNITRDFCDKIDMTVSNDLWLEVSLNERYRSGEFEVDTSRRVGIDSTPPEARNQLYRYFIKDNLSVSKAKFKDDGGSKAKKSRSSKRSTKK